MKALIDGDIIRYSVGFAAEGEPLENCLHSVKLMIENVKNKTGATDYQVYLTGKGNFREKVATTKPYKGNRDASHKPTFFNEITEYLINVHGAVVVDGMEADDAMGIAQCQDVSDTCIASIDKDMDMIPGWHYNWRKDSLYWIDDNTALRFFYKQLLTGDPTDNIQGVPGIGPKSAEKILGKQCTDFTDDFIDEETLYWDILHEYDKKYPKPFHTMMEMAELLWIYREEGKTWSPRW